MSIEHFQNLIIGSGVAGKLLAWTLASQGQKTVVVERVDGRRLLPERGLPAQQECHLQRQGRFACPSRPRAWAS